MISSLRSEHQAPLENRFTLKEDNLPPTFYSKRKEFAPFGSKFFPFGVDPV